MESSNRSHAYYVHRFTPWQTISQRIDTRHFYKTFATTASITKRHVPNRKRSQTRERGDLIFWKCLNGMQPHDVNSTFIVVGFCSSANLLQIENSWELSLSLHSVWQHVSSALLESGTSRAGLRPKKPQGLSQNPQHETGITGQSSSRGI